MNKNFSKIFCSIALAILALSARAQNQSAPQERWLFVFDTSAAMKKRVPAEAASLRNMFAMSFNEHLRAGDSMAAWAFGEKLRTGDFPLIEWQPQFAAQIASNFVAFIQKQHYSGDTTFAALPPVLNQVIADSERLTILIFCDGDEQITWSPYASGINQAFAAARAERKKSKQPIIILLRTQNGQFVGGTVSFPPAAVNLPPFPPLPEPVEIVTNSPPPVVAPKPVATLPPLIIVGTHVGTNAAMLPSPSAGDTNSSSAPVNASTNLPSATNAGLSVAATTNMAWMKNAKTNAVSAISATVIETPTAAQPADDSTKILLVIGCVLFVAALVLVIFFASVARRPRGSLISSSMQNDSHPRK